MASPSTPTAAAPTTTVEQTISFDEFPKEIRLMIYESILTPQKNKLLEITGANATLPPLALTTKLIRSEMIDLLPKFYRDNTFHFTITTREDSAFARAYLWKIPKEYRHHLTRLVISRAAHRRHPAWEARYEVKLNEDGAVTHYHASTRANGKEYLLCRKEGAGKRPLMQVVGFWSKRLSRAWTGFEWWDNEVLSKGCKCEGQRETDWVSGRE